MAKKNKKVKWKNLPSTVRTCLIGMAVFLVTGIGLLIYGMFFGKVTAGDIRNTPGEIVSVDRVDANRPKDQEDYLRGRGFDEDYIRYELKVVYRYTVDGEEYTYETRRNYDEADTLSVGDRENLRYAKVNGKIIINPDTDSTYLFLGMIFIVLGAVSGGVAWLLRPKRK